MTDKPIPSYRPTATDSDKDEDEDRKRSVTKKGVFGETIIVEHDSPVKHKSPYFPDGHLSIEIIGCSGCGKSSMLLSIIPQIANISQIIICSTVTHNKVYDAIRAYCDREDISYALACSPEEAKVTIEDMTSEKEPDKQGLVIFDDFSMQKSGRNDPFNQIAAVVSAVMRNYGYHSIMITQSATNVPTLFRNNSNVRIIFNMQDTFAVVSIRRDVINSGVIRTNEDFNRYYDLVKKAQHAYMMIVTKGTKQQAFIWLPEFNDDQPRLIVDSQNTPIADDARLKALIDGYVSIEGSGKLSSMERRRWKEKIRTYLEYLSREMGIEWSELADQVATQYDIVL